MRQGRILDCLRMYPPEAGAKNKSLLNPVASDACLGITSELELVWHKRVIHARERYVFKTKVCKSLLAERAETFPGILPSDPDGALALHQALQRKSEALQEYIRVQRIYTNLVNQGTAPPADNDPALAGRRHLTER